MKHHKDTYQLSVFDLNYAEGGNMMATNYLAKT